MGTQVWLVLYVLLMVGLIVAVDVLFFRHLFVLRLITNIGIVLLFALVYFVFLRRS